MAIVGYDYDAEGKDVVYYAVTDRYPLEARRIRQLLILALLLSLWSAGRALVLSSEVYEQTQALSKQAKALLEHERVRQIADDPEIIRIIARQQGIPAESVTKERIAYEIQRVRDGLSVLDGVTTELLMLTLLVLLYFPVKYFLLYRGVGQGHPLSFQKIQLTAILQLSAEVTRFLLIGLINVDTVHLKLPNEPSPTLLTAGLLLVYLRTSSLREYFSVFVVRRAPKEMELPEGLKRGGLAPAPARPVEVERIQWLRFASGLRPLVWLHLLGALAWLGWTVNQWWKLEYGSEGWIPEEFFGMVQGGLMVGILIALGRGIRLPRQLGLRKRLGVLIGLALVGLVVSITVAWPLAVACWYLIWLWTPGAWSRLLGALDLAPGRWTRLGLRLIQLAIPTTFAAAFIWEEELFEPLWLVLTGLLALLLLMVALFTRQVGWRIRSSQAEAAPDEHRLLPATAGPEPEAMVDEAG